MCKMVKINIYFKRSARSDCFEIKPITLFSLGEEDSEYQDIPQVLLVLANIVHKILYAVFFLDNFW